MTEWEPASRHVGVPTAPDTNELTAFYCVSTSVKEIYATSSTHTHTLRKSLRPRLHQSSPAADVLPSSPRLITSLLSLAANQAQRGERRRDSGGEQEVCLWIWWCLSRPPLPSSFSIFPYLPISTGGGRGRPNSSQGGLWTTYQSFTLTGEKEKKKGLDESSGVTRLPCSPELRR